MSGPTPTTPDPARYAYLTGRLRDRRITMEEATELFALQQGIIRAAYQGRATGVPPPPSRDVPPPPGSPPPSAGPSAPSFLSDDTMILGLLAVGVGAGLLAALVKHAQVPTPKSPTTAGSERSTDRTA